MADVTSHSWFCVFNNPADHGYEGEPQAVCERLRDEWIQDSATRSGAWVYCISAEGLHHIHMVLEDEKTMRFSTIKASYCEGMHFEVTKGNKAQVEAYVNKEGEFAEKGEQIVCKVQHGEIKGRQGKRTDLDKLSEMIADGQTPTEILRAEPSSYRYKTMLKDMYFDKRYRDTPIVRDVKVYWHVGESGSGKSYSRVELAQKVGEQNIFHLTTFGNGAFDNYCGQPVLWIEDYRGDFPFSTLLRLLDVYKCEVQARYTNVQALWTEVHITSVLTPMQCYPDHCKGHDTITQLLRRITAVIYHFRTDLDFRQISVDPYTTYNAMYNLSVKYRDDDRRTAEILSDPDSWESLEDIGKEVQEHDRA